MEIVQTIDLKKVLEQLPDCVAIVTTGQKATDTVLSLIDAEQPKVGEYTEFECCGRTLLFFRMPSSSRAYPKPLSEKALEYRKMFQKLNLLDK